MTDSLYWRRFLEYWTVTNGHQHLELVTNISYLISTIDVAIDDERALYISNFEIIWNHVQHKFIKNHKKNQGSPGKIKKCLNIQKHRFDTLWRCHDLSWDKFSSAQYQKVQKTAHWSVLEQNLIETTWIFNDEPFNESCTDITSRFDRVFLQNNHFLSKSINYTDEK